MTQIKTFCFALVGTMCAVLLEPDVGTRLSFPYVLHSKLSEAFECYQTTYFFRFIRRLAYSKREKRLNKKETKASLCHFES